MEMMFPSCATKSSSCSFRDGGMFALTCAVRFSRMAYEEKSPAGAGLKRSQQIEEGDALRPQGVVMRLLLRASPALL